MSGNSQSRIIRLSHTRPFRCSLEQPCLRHRRTHSFPDGETNGHALMMQSPIMAKCPFPLPTDSKRDRLPTDTAWPVPAWEIEKSLQLSTSLTLEDEITPIEAWQRISQHPGFAKFNQARLEALKEILIPEVQCYGLVEILLSVRRR